MYQILYIKNVSCIFEYCCTCYGRVKSGSGTRLVGISPHSRIHTAWKLVCRGYRCICFTRTFGSDPVGRTFCYLFYANSYRWCHRLVPLLFVLFAHTSYWWCHHLVPLLFVLFAHTSYWWCHCLVPLLFVFFVPTSIWWFGSAFLNPSFNVDPVG